MLTAQSTSPGTLCLAGRFDASQVEAAESALEEFGDPARLDLSALDYISSAGISVLLRHFKKLKGKGSTLVLVAPPKHVVDVLRYAGLDRIFTIEDGSAPA